MHFSFYSVLSGLAALAVVNALPDENLQRRDTLYVCPPRTGISDCLDICQSENLCHGTTLCCQTACGGWQCMEGVPVD
ncbi:hypothetical protein OG21DRAFT_1507655 [Imleria badia]|nr:hypothetical protein OG21DRAFT_1507655 [Imleria badia]